MEYEVMHKPANHRFEVEYEGYIAYLEYRIKGDTIDITHTFVPHPIEGRGISAVLVDAALQYSKEKYLRVIPTCSYVAAYMKRKNLL